MWRAANGAGTEAWFTGYSADWSNARAGWRTHYPSVSSRSVARHARALITILQIGLPTRFWCLRGSGEVAPSAPAIGSIGELSHAGLAAVVDVTRHRHGEWSGAGNTPFAAASQFIGRVHRWLGGTARHGRFAVSPLTGKVN